MITQDIYHKRKFLCFSFYLGGIGIRVPCFLVFLTVFGATNSQGGRFFLGSDVVEQTLIVFFN